MPGPAAGAGGHPGADAAGRRARGADGGAEVHHRLGVVAGPRRPGVSRAASARRRGLAAGSGSSTAKSRAITRSTLPSTTTAGRSKAMAAIGGGGVGADAGQLAQLRLGGGEAAAALARHHPGAGEQVARPGVVAEAGPGGHHLGVGRRRQVLHGRPAGRRRSRNSRAPPRRWSAAASPRRARPGRGRAARPPPGGTRQGRSRAERSYQARSASGALAVACIRSP